MGEDGYLFSCDLNYIGGGAGGLYDEVPKRGPRRQPPPLRSIAGGGGLHPRRPHGQVLCDGMEPLVGPDLQFQSLPSNFKQPRIDMQNLKPGEFFPNQKIQQLLVCLPEEWVISDFGTAPPTLFWQRFEGNASSVWYMGHAKGWLKSGPNNQWNCFSSCQSSEKEW